MNYQVWIGYHAILQFKSQVAETFVDGTEKDVDDEMWERERENERVKSSYYASKASLEISGANDEGF